MKDPKTICITGPDGSGKSTLIAGVMEKIRKQGTHTIEMITIWDMLLYNPKSQAAIGFKTKAELDRYLEILSPVARTLFLFHVFYQSMEFAKERVADIFLIDSYWYKYYCTEIAHGADKNIISKVTGIFKEPDLTFFLNVTPELAFSRKDKCSGYEIGYAEQHTKEAFLAFQDTAYRIFNELKAQYRWVDLDGTLTADRLVDEVTNAIKEKISC